MPKEPLPYGGDIDLPRRLREWRRERGLSNSEAAKEIGVAASTVSDIENGRKPNIGVALYKKFVAVVGGPPSIVTPSNPDSAAALEALQKRSRSKAAHPFTLTEFSNALDVSPRRAAAAIADLQSQGFSLEVTDAEVSIADLRPSGYTKIPLDHFRDGKWFRFGAIADTHLGNKHARLDVLNSIYDYYESEGIREVLHGGNWIDGYLPRINKHELVTPPTFEAQLQYFIKNYPQKPDMVTRIISGYDHEGWWAKDGFDVGRRMQQSAIEAGRNDLIDMGLLEVDIPFRATANSEPLMLRLTHTGGGSSYAVSYASQKLVETYEGGEKPGVVLIGHLHKMVAHWYRNVAIVQLGCTEGQTSFMRQKRLSAHIGAWVIEMQVSSAGELTRFRPEWLPFYDEGYYNNKYGLTGEPIKVT